MDIHHLVKMANQIGNFFEAYPDRTLAEQEVATHIKRFWDPRMRSQIADHVAKTGGEDLSSLVRDAVRQLEPVTQSD